MGPATFRDVSEREGSLLKKASRAVDAYLAKDLVALCRAEFGMRPGMSDLLY